MKGPILVFPNNQKNLSARQKLTNCLKNVLALQNPIMDLKFDSYVDPRYLMVCQDHEMKIEDQTFNSSVEKTRKTRLNSSFFTYAFTHTLKHFHKF